MPNIRIPNIVKHCCIAIYREGGISARSPKDRFIQSLKIAKSRLQQYGFIVNSGSSEDLTAPIALTDKGRAAEMKHRREGRAKSGLFDTLYDKFDIDGTKAAQDKKLREQQAAQLAAKQDEIEAQRKLARKTTTANKRPNGRRPR